MDSLSKNVWEHTPLGRDYAMLVRAAVPRASLSLKRQLSLANLRKILV